MNIGDVKNIKAAKRYSSAIFKSAVDFDVLDKVYNDLLFAKETINLNPQLKEFLLNPVISKLDVTFELLIDAESVTFI